MAWLEFPGRVIAAVCRRSHRLRLGGFNIPIKTGLVGRSPRPSSFFISEQIVIYRSMHIIGLAGWSGSGKATLLAKIIPYLMAAPQTRCNALFAIASKRSWLRCHRHRPRPPRQPNGPVSTMLASRAGTPAVSPAARGSSLKPCCPCSRSIAALQPSPVRQG